MVGEALKEAGGKNLQLLKMQYNNIDANGVKLLADIHPFLPGLRRVELNGNKFSEEDVNIERLRVVFETRKEEAGGDDDDDEWGLDELDELDDESDDEDEEEEEAEEEEDERESEVKRADEAENETVALDDDKNVDKLAELLGKTSI